MKIALRTIGTDFRTIFILEAGIRLNPNLIETPDTNILVLFVLRQIILINKYMSKI